MKSNWPVVKLEDIASVERGKFSARPRNDPRYYGGNIPFLQTGDVATATGVISSYSQTLNEAGLGVSRLFPAGTLLITIAANIGDIAEVGFDFACPDSLVAVQPKPDTDKDWLKYFLQTKKSYFEGQATQNAQANINLQTIRPLKLPHPPLAEQQAIAEVLSVWDRAIEKTEHLIQAKEKRLNALYQNYFRPDSPATKNWEKIKIGKLVKPRNERAVPSEESPLFSLTIESGVTAKTDRYDREFLVKDSENKTYKAVYPGDIAFNPANLRWGAIARSTVSHKVVLSPIYEVLQINTDAVDPDFLTHALTCPRQIKIYATKTEGTLIERMAVKLDVFLLLQIKAPKTLGEQKCITETLDLAQREIELLKKLAEKQKLQKRGLMQKLLTGTWRVKMEGVE